MFFNFYKTVPYFNKCIDFKVIQTKLCYSHINTTLNTYSHVNKSMQKNATDKLNSF
ncbi:integrase [Clostridium sporogenes]|nr:integrase [Clostridium sporogenes]